jgi:ADP-ribose pyrophosphatase
MQHKKKLSGETILDNWYKKVVSKDFLTKNWEIYNYLILSNSKEEEEGVMILALTQKKEIIYIKEFRVGREEYIYSFPAGNVEKEISLENNAIKELKEETGYIWENIQYLWQTIIANYERETMDYFFIDNCSFVGQELENGEDIEVFTCSKEDFEEKIKSWLINCPLTIACFTLAKMKNLL